MPVAPVLWVTDEPPDRNLGGGNIRQAHLVTALAERLPTTLLVAAHLHDVRTRAALASVIEVPVVKFVPRSETLRRLRDLGHALAGPSEIFDNRATVRALRPRLRPWVEGGRLIVVTHQGLMPLLPNVRRGFWASSVHHVSSQMAQQRIVAVAPGRRQRWLHERESFQAERLEQWGIRNYDAVITCSEDDALCLRVPASKLIVAPNGVDVDRYAASPIPPEPRVLLPASLNYFPNVDGATWFCAEVWGRIRAELPDAELDLCGRAPAEDVLALAKIAGVAVHGDVESMAPWLQRARLVVVPIRVGTGTRLKVLEAMAAGRPVVGTTIGLGGLGLRDGVDAAFRDDPSAMATAIVGLLRDHERAERMASAARETVERRFAWDRIAGDFVDALLDRAGL